MYWFSMNCVLLYLTHKQPEMHGCVISTVATAALVLNLKHQAIIIHSTELIM